MGSGLIWACPKCNRDYPDKGKPIRCICKAGGSKSKTSGEYNPQWPCTHRGSELGILDCGCAGKPKVFDCSVHGVCSLRKMKPGVDGYLTPSGEKVPAEITYCNRCPDRNEA